MLSLGAQYCQTDSTQMKKKRRKSNLVRSVKFEDQRIAKRMQPMPVAAKPMIISDRSTIDL